jgi:uncharacterized membrane protein
MLLCSVILSWSCLILSFLQLGGNSMTSLDPVTLDPSPSDAMPVYRIKTITLGAPLVWLKRGAEDFLVTRFRGALYGLVFACMGLTLVFVYETRWQLTMGLTAGFFLLGPFVCAGLYELSRQREHGHVANLFDSMVCWKRNIGSIAFFAVILTFCMIVWARVSVVIFALFSQTDFPTLQGMLKQIISFDNLEFLAVWMLAGFMFASLVFAISVVAVPLMLDRRADTMSAIFTSARALWANMLPLYLWAALIVVLIGFSLVLSYVGLILTAPVIGHATWHAYRDLVAQAEEVD